jgi:3D (Asp-Asp-Asp) domain-containing protein
VAVVASLASVVPHHTSTRRVDAVPILGSRSWRQNRNHETDLSVRHRINRRNTPSHNRHPHLPGSRFTAHNAHHVEAVSLGATSYCQGTVTASGQRPYVGEVANNMWPLGTRIVVSPPVWGLSRFVVEDRIGAYSQIDFYNPSCGAADDFGRRIERVRVER